jgi:hypothetical protein
VAPILVLAIKTLALGRGVLLSESITSPEIEALEEV